MRLSKSLVSVLVLALLAAPPASARPSATGWDRMKSLVGSWQGTGEGKVVSVRYALVSNGTALMETLDGDHDVTMITMYAPDAATVLATHYCAAGNQPRMRAAASPDGKSLAFEFVDASNVTAASADVMRSLVVTFVDADHFEQEWTSRAADGKEHTSVFRYSRKH
ncbi:MAG TPA: hypothetical protein VN032_03500 [Thermoanaerobaculia bacterium]|jgi:hypothetical protein|nr:hypothetical protein [Thermoanaerobaculia bacterium]